MSIIIEVDSTSSSLKLSRIIKDLDAQSFSWSGVMHEATNEEGEGGSQERGRGQEQERVEDFLAASSQTRGNLLSEPVQDGDDWFYCSDDDGESECECPYILVHVAGVANCNDDDLYAEYSMVPDPILSSTMSASRGWDSTDD